MRKVALSAIIFLGCLSTAQAADPLGEWLVEDGVATIKVVDCNGHIWGVVASEKTPGGVDSNNPDKTKRTRPTLGMPVLLDMKPDTDEKGKWAGHIYNAKDGKTYEASIQPTSATQLKVEGCVLGFLCGGQTWTRVPEPAALPGQAGAKPAATPGMKTAAPAPTAGKTTGQKGAAPGQPTSDICMIPDIAGSTH
jgi:uncharacterized protein (DUF2147 family)